MPTRPASPLASPVVFTVALAAAAAPSLLAYNIAPSPTFLNQALACGLWGALVAVCGLQQRPTAQAAPVLLALALLAGAVGFSYGWRALPPGLALSALGLLAATAVLLLAGSAAGAGPQRQALFAAFCWAWVGAGAFNLLVALVQVFAPQWADGHWVAVSASPGRAIGNLRQPNHLSSLFMWAGVAVVGLLLLRQLALRWAALALAALVFGVVLTASRTGGVSVALLALWGLLDRRLPRPARLLLLAAPLMYALSWWGLSQWAALSQSAFGAEQRLAEADISGSRFGIWANTWQLILQQPLAGVGFGNFNLAWTLTPFPNRPVAFFDHSHNLPLHLAAELGLPLASLVLGLLLWALLRAWWRALQHSDATQGAVQRCALLMVVMIGLHSLLEYPLWYAYFLLPTAWALGFGAAAALAPGQAPRQPAAPSKDWPHTGHPVPSPAARNEALTGRTFSKGAVLAGAGALLAVGAVASVVDYKRVAVIYRATNAYGSLNERIQRGQASVLFGHQADYAAATSAVSSNGVNPAFDRASHNLLDTRLMVAWAQALADQGDLDRARYLAARLREFRKAEATELFDSCPDRALPVAAAPMTAAAPLPAAAAAQATPAPADNTAAAHFACELPVGHWGWRQFLKTTR